MLLRLSVLADIFIVLDSGLRAAYCSEDLLVSSSFVALHFQFSSLLSSVVSAFFGHGYAPTRASLACVLYMFVVIQKINQEYVGGRSRVSSLMGQIDIVSHSLCHCFR